MLNIAECFYLLHQNQLIVLGVFKGSWPGHIWQGCSLQREEKSGSPYLVSFSSYCALDQKLYAMKILRKEVIVSRGEVKIYKAG